MALGEKGEGRWRWDGTNLVAKKDLGFGCAFSMCIDYGTIMWLDLTHGLACSEECGGVARVFDCCNVGYVCPFPFLGIDVFTAPFFARKLGDDGLVFLLRLSGELGSLVGRPGDLVL